MNSDDEGDDAGKYEDWTPNPIPDDHGFSEKSFESACIPHDNDTNNYHDDSGLRTGGGIK